MSVALVEQPYRVRRTALSRSGKLGPDAAWTAVSGQLHAGELRGLSLITGGRSPAPAACRTAAATGAVGVLCLAFPLQPPRRKTPAPTVFLLDAVPVPTLVVQGTRDAFVHPARRPAARWVGGGDHSLATDLEAVAAAVRDWLPSVVG